jgi:hypothetical protein
VGKPRGDLAGMNADPGNMFLAVAEFVTPRLSIRTSIAANNFLGNCEGQVFQTRMAQAYRTVNANKIDQSNGQSGY